MKAIILFFVFLLLIPSISAYTYSSPNYNLILLNTNYGANSGSSPNYNIEFSLTDQPVGVYSSSNYNVDLGFYYIEAEVPTVAPVTVPSKERGKAPTVIGIIEPDYSDMIDFLFCVFLFILFIIGILLIVYDLEFSENKRK